jgi:CheY-like chemotaxis protein
VLVVDDNSDQVMMLTGCLRLSGFTVRSAYTGPDGLDLALQWRPDIVLLDIGLPGMDGYEVARRLRAAEAGERSQGGKVGRGGKNANPTRPMRLIALTGRGQDGDRTLAREVGFAAYLTKPCDPEYLAMMMAALTHTKPAE